MTWLPSINEGRGNPNIICPMDIYIRSKRKPSEAMSLFFIRGVSVSLSSSSAGAAADAPFTEAP